MGTVLLLVAALTSGAAAYDSKAAEAKRTAELQAKLATKAELSSKAEAVVRQAMLAYDEGDFPRALTLAKKAYAIYPIPMAFFALGQIHRALGHWKLAGLWYRAYLKKLPDAPDETAVLGYIREVEANQRAQAASGKPPPAPAPAAAAKPAAAPAAPAAPQALRVGLASLETGGAADAKLGEQLGGAMLDELRKRTGLAVTGPEDIAMLLGADKLKALAACADAACYGKYGAEVGLDQLVVGKLSRSPEKLALVLRVVDVAKGEVLRGVKRGLPAAAGAEQKLIDAIPDALAELVPPLPEPAPAAAVAPAPAAAVSGSTSPAASGRSNAPWWLTGTGAVVAVLGGGLFAYEIAERQTPTQLDGSSTYPGVTQGQAQMANTLGYAGQAALGVGVALLAAGITWALVRPAPPPEATP